MIWKLDLKIEIWAWKRIGSDWRCAAADDGDEFENENWMDVDVVRLFEKRIWVIWCVWRYVEQNNSHQTVQFPPCRFDGHVWFENEIENLDGISYTDIDFGMGKKMRCWFWEQQLSCSSAVVHGIWFDGKRMIWNENMFFECAQFVCWLFLIAADEFLCHCTCLGLNFTTSRSLCTHICRKCTHIFIIFKKTQWKKGSKKKLVSFVLRKEKIKGFWNKNERHKSNTSEVRKCKEMQQKIWKFEKLRSKNQNYAFSVPKNWLSNILESVAADIEKNVKLNIRTTQCASAHSSQTQSSHPTQFTDWISCTVRTVVDAHIGASPRRNIAFVSKPQPHGTKHSKHNQNIKNPTFLYLSLQI